jgi:chromosome segregation protein
MQGFKSFARRTEIPLENAMNVIVGPNGSGKSNIADALCFVLGRMSAKSMRAEKAANLLFTGTKIYKGSNEAMVELVFDNEDGSFSLDSREVSIKRIVRKNGLSVYKINNETKTRQELIELLAQAGIDPNGFNLVLQGEIAAMIKMSSDERRKIIEEVAGISIYESRKERSLRELEKIEEKLKETNAVLREKNNYLRNLEKDRQDALSYKKTEIAIKQCKATILDKDIKEKDKEIAELEKQKAENLSKISKIKENLNKTKIEINFCEERVKEITLKVESSTSGEQDVLHREISDLKADLAGFNVRRENYEERLNKDRARISSLVSKIKELEEEIDSLVKQSPEVKKQKEVQKELEQKVNELEKKRRAYYELKSEISSLESKKEDKRRIIIQSEKELEIIEKNISQIFGELKHSKSLEKAEEIKKECLNSLNNLREKIENLDKEILQLEKNNAVLEQIIGREKKLIGDIANLDVCPLCRSNVTENHKKDVVERAKGLIVKSEEGFEENLKKKSALKKSLEDSVKNISLFENKIKEIELEIVKIKSCDEKKDQIKRIVESSEDAENSIKEIEKKLSSLIKEFESLKNVEEKYDEAKLSLKELSFVDKDLDNESSMKKRDVEKMKSEIKSLERDMEDSSKELKGIVEKIEDRRKILIKKENQEQELYERFQKSYNERNEIQDRQKALETNAMGLQHEIRGIEERNYGIKLKEAEINARLESLISEFEEFKDIELVSGSRESLVNRLNNLQGRLNELGNINMRALELYDQVKQVCDSIQEKVDVVNREKEKILEIVKEIDKKKKKSFMRTLDAVNELFTRNFSQVSKKGEVSLDLENREDPFAGGLDILVKVGRGKYFDVNSLSGGEKTLVALSLIFAIQEHKPYSFYIFDEIDAALDKHNSELLAGLIKKYMVSGQYIIVTHNDALIEAAPVLFGVSMQDGISKIISQRL